jgi:serine/threonine-protein kinase
MNDRESQLLYGILALQLNYCSKEQLVAAMDSWMARPDEDLAEILERRGYVTQQQTEALSGLVSAHLARVTGRGLPVGYVPDAREAAETILMSRDGKVPPAEPPDPLPPGARFELGKEIGRGGLARVVEAEDREIGRTVALKLMLEDSPGDALQRFRWEARITGRLEHPNIVPVHEVGLLPGSKEIYFCMKRIHGRDMHHVIREGAWKLRRLVEAFRDVCRATAYAHSKGVVHRDLKPANVMLGDFGETLVMDWGLAAVKGEAGPPARKGGRSVASADDRPVTEDGEILGTPAYMAPEQAQGRRDEIDERTDVYALGAILYEILTGRPPFEGRNATEIIRKVAQSPLMPPSARASVPPELEAICVRAMGRRKEERYASAAELAADVEAYLEGTKEAERREKAASGQVARARDEISRWRALTADARAAKAEASRLQGEIPEYEGAGAKRPLWTAQDRERELERGAVTAFSEADAALASALSNDPDHAEARALRAELYWERFLQSEEAGDEAGMLLNRQTAERFNDGVLDARLRGDGTLEVATRAYGCRCLRQGRKVEPAELSVHGHHPWSGRSGASVGLPDLEPAEALRLRVHGRECTPQPAPGAQVWAFRYEEIDRVLVPVTPHGGETPVPRAALDQLWGASPFRPRGGGIYLGRTPVARGPWPMGSWLFVFVSEGRAPLRVPVHVGRQEDVSLAVTLYAPDEVPPGFAPVAAGRFRWQGDRSTLSPLEASTLDLEDFFLAVHPVTCREYAEFLNDLAAADAAEAARRVPRSAERGGYAWPWVPGRGYVVPTREWLDSAPEELRAKAGRLAIFPSDWEGSWPATGISWEDMTVYARWASLRLGLLLHLPVERQWEKAARGPDGRFHPWGNHWDATLGNISQSHRDGGRPVGVSGFPTDESPYGIRGLAGNVSDRCLNEPEDPHGRRITRGGNWMRSPVMARAAYRSAGAPKEVHAGIGFRLAGVVKV